MTEVYVERLAAARERLAADRCAIAAELAKPYDRGKTEEWRKSFVEIQTTIDAIDRAVSDERHIAEKGKPVSFGPTGR
jgi:hypothetical protein